MNYIPNNLKEYRQRAGLRQRDIALRLGLDCIDRISKWENGLAYPSVTNLFKRAQIYRVAAEELYKASDGNTCG